MLRVTSPAVTICLAAFALLPAAMVAVDMVAPATPTLAQPQPPEPTDGEPVPYGGCPRAPVPPPQGGYREPEVVEPRNGRTDTPTVAQPEDNAADTGPRAVPREYRGTVVNAMLADESLAKWWHRARTTVLASSAPDTEGAYFLSPSALAAASRGGPLATSLAMRTLAGGTVDADMVALLQTSMPRSASAELIGWMREFMLLALDASTHEALRLPELFADRRGELPAAYGAVQELIASEAIDAVLAALLATTPAAGETPLDYLGRATQSVTLDRATARALRALPDVAARLAAFAVEQSDALARADHEFGRAVLPSDADGVAELADQLAMRLGVWTVTTLDAPEQMTELAGQLEINLAQLLAGSSQRSAMGRWARFYDALVEGLAPDRRFAANMILIEVIGDFVRDRLAANNNDYAAQLPTLRAQATALAILRDRLGQLTADAEGAKDEQAGAARWIVGVVGSPIALTIDDVARNALQVMRFVNEENREALGSYVYVGDEQHPRHCQHYEFTQGPALDYQQAYVVLQELLSYKPTVVLPLVRQALEDERTRREMRLARPDATDMAYDTPWSALVARHELRVTATYVEDLLAIRGRAAEHQGMDGDHFVLGLLTWLPEVEAAAPELGADTPGR